MRKAVLALLVIIALAALAVQTGYARPLIVWQVQRSLVASGIGEGRAECMAGRMVNRLSLMQLWTLRQAMAPREGEPEQARGLFGSIKRLRRTEDGEIIGVVTSSAALCAIGLG
ncbi:MAG: hypothetical protein ACK4IS_06700 [Erythrobacter sp.]